MKTKTLALALLTTLILAFAATPPVSAQKGSFELGLGAGLTTLDDKLGGDTGGSVDFRAGYFVTDRVALELQTTYASSILEGSFEAHTLNVVYHFEGVEGDFIPYVLFGAGTADAQVDDIFIRPVEDDGTALRAAFGGRFEIGKPGHATSRLELSVLNEDSFDDDATHISFSFLFGWRFES